MNLAQIKCYKQGFSGVYRPMGSTQLYTQHTNKHTVIYLRAQMTRKVRLWSQITVEKKHIDCKIAGIACVF